MSENLVVTGHQSPSEPNRGRIFIALAVAISVVMIPPLIGKLTLYRAQNISCHVYVIELLFRILTSLATAGGIWILGRTLGRQSLDIIWFRRNRNEIICTLLLIIGAPTLCGLVSALIHHWGWMTRADRTFYANGLPIAFFVAITIHLTLVTPIMEELFWRGSVQKALTSVVGAAGAWILQAIFFAAIHWRPVGGFMVVFAFGLMTGLWRWRRRTLLPVILAHFALNSLYCAAQWPDWLELSRIRIVNDYNAERVELSRPQPYDPNQDARHDYEQAIETFTALPDEFDEIITEDLAEWTPQQYDAIVRWIAANSRALDHIAQGADKPYYCPDYQIENAHLPTAKWIRSLAFALNARIKLHAHEGREDEMVRDIVTLDRLGRHFAGKKVLLHQLMGVAIRGIAAGTTRKMLAHHDLSTHALDTLYEKYQAFSETEDSIADFTLERLFCLDEIQRIFTDDGRGHGHVVEAAIDAAPGMTVHEKEAFLKLERHETTQQVDAFFKHIQIAAHQSPWQRHSAPNGTMLALQNLMRQNALIQSIGPAYVQTIDRPWQMRVELDAVVTVLAILRHRAYTGGYPESLDELVAEGYLVSAPPDHCGPGPLVYRPTGQGFLLYSYGLDFDDDSGTPSRWGRNEGGGDQVFWPVD